MHLQCAHLSGYKENQVRQKEEMWSDGDQRPGQLSWSCLKSVQQSGLFHPISHLGAPSMQTGQSLNAFLSEASQLEKVRVRDCHGGNCGSRQADMAMGQ